MGWQCGGIGWDFAADIGYETRHLAEPVAWGDLQTAQTPCAFACVRAGVWKAAGLWCAGRFATSAT
ncbi:MAG: hypothetical protein ACOYLO_18345 [Ferruginibacter sp.]